MKFIRLVTVAALSTTILAGGVSAVANEVQKADTDATVNFSAVDEDGNGEDTVVINPVAPEDGGPDVEIAPIDPDGEGNTGPLTIAYAPTMDFGQQVISNQDRTYTMIAEQQPLKDGSGDVPYVSFAQVQDTRGTNEGWDLRVTLSDFENNDVQTRNTTLYGTEIEFTSPTLEYVGNEGNEPAVHAPNLVLSAGGEAQSVLSAETGRGSGTSSVVWGDQMDLNNSTSDIVRNEGILLHIPGATAKDAVEYAATLTWELNQSPGMAGETIN